MINALTIFIFNLNNISYFYYRSFYFSLYIF
nr:MAG TPA: hypothetical protein [Caudoviricetes sp.]